MVLSLCIDPTMNNMIYISNSIFWYDFDLICNDIMQIGNSVIDYWFQTHDGENYWWTRGSELEIRLTWLKGLSEPYTSHCEGFFNCGAAELRAHGRHGYVLTSNMEAPSTKTLRACVGEIILWFLKTYWLLMRHVCVEVGFTTDLRTVGVVYSARWRSASPIGWSAPFMVFIPF